MAALDGLRDKLHALAAADPGFTLFGAEKHKYQLGSVLSEDEISKLEEQYQMKLPEGYRQFLMEMGDGGAGPYYGLYALAEAIGYSDVKQFPDILSKPFPLEKPLDVFGECVGEGTFDDYYERIEDDEDYYEEILECKVKFSGPYYSQGTLYLCDYGDAIPLRMGVTGPESGNMWVEDLQGDFGGIFPVSEEGKGTTRTTFLKWYENWLDMSLSRAQDGKQGAGEDVGGYFEYA